MREEYGLSTSARCFGFSATVRALLFAAGKSVWRAPFALTKSPPRLAIWQSAEICVICGLLSVNQPNSP